jgi:hypothetical protein
MNQEKEISKSHQCYFVNDNVKKFVTNALNLERNRNKFKEQRSAAGIARQKEAIEIKRISEEFRRRKRSLDARKVTILNTYVFPSMAIITYFMEELAHSPLLYDMFEEEVKELLLATGKKEGEGSIFNRLVRACISRPVLQKKKGKGKRKRNEDDEVSPDFRIMLGEWMQRAVYEIVKELGPRKFDDAHFQQNVLLFDMNRALSYTKQIARGAKVEFDEGRRPHPCLYA